MSIPNDYHFYREFYIKTQIARIDETLNQPHFASQEALEDSWQGDSELHQLQTTYKNVPEKREVCYRRNSQGLLEEITDKGFGSTKGLFGAAVGYSVADELGIDSDAGRIVAGLIGNKIGNNWDNKSKADECRIETVSSAVPYNAPVVIGYQITGRLKDGTIAYVTRDFKPELGELITVNTRVW